MSDKDYNWGLTVYLNPKQEELARKIELELELSSFSYQEAIDIFQALREVLANKSIVHSFTPVYVPKDEEEAKMIQARIDEVISGGLTDSEKQSTERVYPPIEPKEGEHPTAVYSFHRSNTPRQGE